LQITTATVINLNLNGKTIDLNEHHIDLYSNTPTFNLYDIHQGNTVGKLTNGKSSDGGAIYINYGCFSLYGGKIENCIATTSGGAVYVGTGEFNMRGGSIVGCESTNEFKGGGAVFISDAGKFVMYDGTIDGCESAEAAGAVYVRVGQQFVMYDGTIKNCVAATKGGAVECSEGSFHMYGGTLTGNKANYGGAVYNGQSVSSFHMHGGTITGNKAKYAGGGVYDSAGDISFDGKCIVKDNYSYGGNNLVDSNKKRDNVFSPGFTIGNEGAEGEISDKTLKADSEIWVTLVDGSKSGIMGYFTKDDSGSQTYKQYFRSDADAYYVEYDSSEVELSLESRITQEPTPTNNYTVKVRTDNLSNTNITYYWYKRNFMIEKLEDFTISPSDVIHGIVNTSGNKINSDLDAGKYKVEIIVPRYLDSIDAAYVTFTSENENLDVNTSSPLYAGLYNDGEKYIYKAELIEFGGDEVFKLCIESSEEFTLENVKFEYNWGYDYFNDYSSTLYNGTLYQTYLCMPEFNDGSYLQSKDTLVISETLKKKTNSDQQTKDESCEKVIGPTWHWNNTKGVCEEYTLVRTNTR